MLDADGPPGGIVVGAPTHYTFRAEFAGTAAHAGVEPESGISALRMAAEAIVDMPIGRLDAETTANVGTIEGGVATNVVPAAVEVTGECRSLDRDRVEEVRRVNGRGSCAKPLSVMGVRSRSRGSASTRGFRLTEDDPSVQLVMSACRDIGIEPHTFATGGGSDANVIAAHGVSTLALALRDDRRPLHHRIALGRRS